MASKDFVPSPWLKARSKLSGSQAGKAARFQALHNQMMREKRAGGSTKITGMRPEDVDVEEMVKKSPGRRMMRARFGG